jgi:RNA polymerase sigma-70 factor (ECF subfamily)
VRAEPGKHALLVRARQYDEAALAELYDCHAPRVYAYVYRRVGDPHLAEDLVGDVFVRVVEAIHSKRPWHTSFRAWLYRIAHNVVVDHYRRPQPVLCASLDKGWPSGVEESPRDPIGDTLDHQRLRAALHHLTQEQQQVLVLRFGEGLTIRETARVLHKTTGAVKALQHRAIIALRRILTRQARSRVHDAQHTGEPAENASYRRSARHLRLTQ